MQLQKVILVVVLIMIASSDAKKDDDKYDEECKTFFHEYVVSKNLREECGADWNQEDFKNFPLFDLENDDEFEKAKGLVEKVAICAGVALESSCVGGKGVIELFNAMLNVKVKNGEYAGIKERENYLIASPNTKDKFMKTVRDQCKAILEDQAYKEEIQKLSQEEEDDVFKKILNKVADVNKCEDNARGAGPPSENISKKDKKGKSSSRPPNERRSSLAGPPSERSRN